MGQAINRIPYLYDRSNSQMVSQCVISCPAFFNCTQLKEAMHETSQSDSPGPLMLVTVECWQADSLKY